MIKETPRWEPPHDGWIKCNVDAAFMMESRSGASGGVLRNSDGVFVGAQARRYDHCLDALLVEAWACRDGLQLASAYGVTKLCIETDSVETVRLWGLKETQRSVISQIFMEMHELSLQFSEFVLKHTSRVCNSVAHELVKRVSGEPVVFCSPAHYPALARV